MSRGRRQRRWPALREAIASFVKLHADADRVEDVVRARCPVSS
jgi:hypothetical protein